MYKYTARGLFERHKLLLSLQMCIRILQTANQVNTEEWQFFLKGGSVLDRSQQPANPNPLWISEEAWDNITVRDVWGLYLYQGRRGGLGVCGRGYAFQTWPCVQVHKCWGAMNVAASAAAAVCRCAARLPICIDVDQPGLSCA